MSIQSVEIVYKLTGSNGLVDDLHVPSGITLTIDSGATIVNNGTATGFGSGGSTAWGAITGTLSNQTDLQAALNAKQDTITVLPSANGGTGFSAYTQGDLIYASATNTLSKLAKSPTASRYLSNQGVANAPSWLQINLGNGVTGTLPVLSGGTGASTYTDGQLLIGNTLTGGLTKATLTQGANITITNANGAITIAASVGSGDMAKTVYDPQNAGYISGADTGGILKMDGDGVGVGGNVSTYANGGVNGGTISTIAGGDINTSSGGGSISTSSAGGSISTSGGGGSINTAGTGIIEFGGSGTRTSLEGSASSDRALTLPDKDGTLITDGDLSPWATLATTTPALSFSAAPQVIGLTISGDTTFTASGYIAGFKITIHITPDTSDRALVFPGGWRWYEGMPATVPANKVMQIDLFCTGTSEADVRATYGVEL